MRVVEVSATAVQAQRQYATLIGAARHDPATHRLHDRSNFILIELRTDDGLVGLGEVSDIPEGMRLPGGAALSAESLAGWLRERLTGLDPFALEAVPARLGVAGAGRGGGMSLLLCAVDAALYDLMGKAAGQPAYQFCGGRARDAVLVSYVAFIREPELLAEELAQQTARGFRAFKLKVGLDPERDVAAMRVAREVAGDGASIKLDANGAWSADEAIAVLRRVERYHPVGVETPVRADDFASMRRVKEETGVPLLEHVSSPRYALDVVRAGAVDVFNVSCVGCGGIYRARKVLAVAEAAGIPCLLGSTVELGVGTAQQLHLAASSPAVTWPSDLIGPLLYTADVTAEAWRWRDGSLVVPDGPGLGVSLDPAAVAAMAA